MNGLTEKPKGSRNLKNEKEVDIMTKTINSRQKGARGERELARMFREQGYDCRRGQQYNGLEGEDVVGLPGIHVECKRVERLNLYDAIDQAKRDAGGKIPAVYHRKNNCGWLVIMTLDDWFRLFREWEAGNNE